MSTNQYIRFVDHALKVIKAARIPLYSCKFSKKTYSQHQLLILLLLREYIGEDYRDTVDIDIMDQVRELIDSIRSPFHTPPEIFLTNRLISPDLSVNALLKMFGDYVTSTPTVM